MVPTRDSAADPREVVALVQRRSLAFLPVWAALIIAGVSGAAGLATPGRPDPMLPLLVYLAGFAAMFALRRWHRRWYGDVRLTDSQRLRGRLAGLAMFLAFVAMAVLGPAAVPSPMPFTFAVIFALSLFSDPWRVSLHWLLLVGILLWLSVIHVVGPDVLARPPLYSLLIGAAGVVACVIDHVLLLRRIRKAPDGMVIGGQHA